MNYSTIEIIETNKGKPLAIHDGYQYRKYRENYGKIITWVCLKEKKEEKCKGRLKTKNSIVLNVTTHRCKYDMAKIEVKKQYNIAKKRVREGTCSPTLIFREEITPLFDKGLNTITEIPTYASIRTTLNRIRRKTLGNPLGFKLRENEIIVPGDVSRLSGYSEFILFDDGNEERILAFSTMKGREIASQGKICFIDGTLKSCSKQLYQIYTIHFDIGCTAEQSIVIPVIFALFLNKTKLVYDRLFSLIKKYIPNFNPDSIALDFETAAIQSARKYFPNAKIYGCNLHFNRLLWRKVQNIGLTGDYDNDEDIRLHVQMCSALAHIPIDDIDEGWIMIMENTPEVEKLRRFYDYFVEQWLDNTLFTRDTWNCYWRKLHRTNSIVKEWNSELNELLSKPWLTFFELYDFIKSEAEYCDRIHERSVCRTKDEIREIMYPTLQIDEQIKNTLDAYKLDRDLRKCLKTIATIQELA